MQDLYAKYAACGYRVTTDSRTIGGGEIFFALRGENFDGNAFAARALEAGAAWAVVNRDCALVDARLIRVDDPYAALRELSIHHRRQMRDGKLPVIGLTGTNGKTTTKNLIREVLARKFNVCATEGNLNNDIGVPLSLLKIRPETEIAVIEMGANHPDDILKLVRISQPDYGLITNIGRGHLLGFGSFDGVKAAKEELYKWLGSHPGSLIFLNEDDCLLRTMASVQPCHQFGYGLGYQGVEIMETGTEHPFLRLRFPDGTLLRTRLVGSYNAPNVLAALAVGEYFGVERAAAFSAIEDFDPDNSRSQLVRTERNTVIADAYNANPTSMAAALGNFLSFGAERKVALLGDMRELGSESVEEHRKLLPLLEGVEAYLVGEEWGRALEAAGPQGAMWFADSDALAMYLGEHPLSGALVLVKGSRGIRMEKVLPVL